MKEKKAMQISELVRMTGVPASTIRFYIREGLLPQPVRTGKTRAYYSEEHIKYIELIKKNQATGKRSLNEIREQVVKKISTTKPKPKITAPSQRDKIIEAATDLFSIKGYEETSINDITSQAKISKETFYLQFRNKEELLLECADIVFRNMYKDVWEQLRNEKDIVQRSSKRAKAFFVSYPKWITMMNIIRGLAVGNLTIKQKFKALLAQMINPMIKEHELLKRQKIITRKTDSSLSGYFTMGMAEYGALLISRGICRDSEVIDYINEIMLNGF